MPLTRLILLTTSLWLASFGLLQAKAFSTIVIDAGHGGKDYGGSYGKVYEKHLALDTAQRVEYMLKKKGYRTRMTRSSDVFLSLQKRASIGNRYGNSIFVSIHYNCTYRRAAKGIETFYYTSRSKPLAQYVHMPSCAGLEPTSAKSNTLATMSFVMPRTHRFCLKGDSSRIAASAELVKKATTAKKLQKASSQGSTSTNQPDVRVACASFSTDTQPPPPACTFLGNK